MTLYTVHAPPARAGEDGPDPMGYVFVKEGFCWPALIAPELWLLFRRLWLVFFTFVAVSLVVIAVSRSFGGPLPYVFLLLMHLLFALEGNQLRRWTLGRRGYRLVGVAEGGNLYNAENRFFLATHSPPRDPTQPPPERMKTALRTEPAPPKPAQPAQPVEPSAEAGDVVGLFPNPGGSGA